MKKHLSIFTVLALLGALLSSGCGTLSPDEVTNHSQVKAFNLGPEVNSRYDDFATDMHENRMLFTSNRPTIEGYIQGDDIWFTDREATAWSKALNIGGSINSERDEGAPFIISDGTEVYFVQCWTVDGTGDCDIYSAVFNYRGQWQSMQNLGENINTKYWDSHPSLSSDGQELYFASSRPGGEGGTDIWVSTRLRSGRWGPAKNLGPGVNTSGNEKCPLIAPNGTDLFLASDGRRGLGGYDIFLSRSNGKKGWSEAQNIGVPFNTQEDELFFRLSSEEDTVFISSRREGGMGGYDIWGFTPNPFKDTSRYTYHLMGVVYDSTTEQGISNATLRVKRGNELPAILQLGRNGRYKVRVKTGERVELDASAPMYLPRKTSIDIPSTLVYNEYRKNVGLPPDAEAIADTGTKIGTAEKDVVMYFEFDKSDLRSDDVANLDRMFLQRIQPLLDGKTEFEIVLSAHTDDWGTDDYNVRLSRRRGASVSRYLRDKGVPISAIIVNAYGETQPVDTNQDPNGRQRNRRVEIDLKTTMH